MPISTPELKFCAAALCVGMALITSPVHAKKTGCEYRDIDYRVDGLDTFESATSYSSINGVLNLVMEVKYANHEIAGCDVHHRGYNGLLTGPTLRLKPGDTLDLTIVNSLPPNPVIDPEDRSKPHDFNTTNFHTHGLHVDPTGISDNVLRKMAPRKKPGDTAPKYHVLIEIPEDHPPGTFWYHAHVHGSTAIQVSSGMAGALIIEGGLDDVPDIKKAKEKILLFQQISYDEDGLIEKFDEIFGPGKMEKHGRRTTINGQIVPVIKMHPGEVQRWRLIHGGVRETLMVHLTGHSLHEIAVDGLALGKCVGWDGSMPEKRVELQPGYRSDVLVKAAGNPGTYLLVDGETLAVDALHGVAERRKVLAKVVVEGDPMDMRFPCDRDELDYLVPLDPITDAEIKGTQKVVFCVCPASGGVEFTVNGKSFDPDKNIRELKLGSADEWTLTTDIRSVAPNHPFHIHVNPFQVERKGPDGKLEWIWRDTLLVKQGPPIKIRSRYVRYTGDFVLHCHILDHEDQGMMQVVRIVK